MGSTAVMPGLTSSMQHIALSIMADVGAAAGGTAQAAEVAAPARPTAQDALQSGVMIVVSLPSQQMFVFKDGKVWDSSPVSTGKRGHVTPTGAFAILQKKQWHRSNLYSNAPMPYMQRLTWDGIAMHAGPLPGYPASHGCIRLPAPFARRLFALTSPASTLVLVTDRPAGTASQAFTLASGEAPPPDLAGPPPQLAYEPVIGVPMATARRVIADSTAGLGRAQTIQLAAVPTPDSAERFWQELSRRKPELQGLAHEVIPARVNAMDVYRLRASGPQAHAICSRLSNEGIACIRIAG